MRPVQSGSLTKLLKLPGFILGEAIRSLSASDIEWMDS